MSERSKAWIVIACVMAFAFIFFWLLSQSWEEIRGRECAALRAVGARHGETIVIAGDMPTWKIECLFDNGGK